MFLFAPVAISFVLGVRAKELGGQTLAAGVPISP